MIRPDPADELRIAIELGLDEFRIKMEESCQAYLEKHYPDLNARVRLKISVHPIITIEGGHGRRREA